MSPDWSGTPEDVPYASFGDPQTLNLYSYVRDNPLAQADLNGHAGDCVTQNCYAALAQKPEDAVQKQQAVQTPKAQQQNQNQNQQVQHGTLVGAGIAAERKYNPTSIKQDKEYAGWIEKTKNGKYVVDPAHPGTQARSDPGPRPQNSAGEYHTHGGNDPVYDNEHFSNQDKWFLHNNHVPGFLGTPGHTIQEYDPATGKVIIFKERTD
ncbi:MAG: DUF4329 domain-containing protein [Candidatus Acidiferrales bacterium]